MDGRTDLAMEAYALWKQDAQDTTQLPGVKAREEDAGGVHITRVDILDERGQAALGKPVGRYVTLELRALARKEEGSFEQAAQAIGREASAFLHSPGSALCAGLGNDEITPDAFGPWALGSILVTRHMKQRLPEAFSGFCSVSAVKPGVLGTSGMEALELVRAAADFTAGGNYRARRAGGNGPGKTLYNCPIDRRGTGSRLRHRQPPRGIYKAGARKTGSGGRRADTDARAKPCGAGTSGASGTDCHAARCGCSCARTGAGGGLRSDAGAAPRVERSGCGTFSGIMFDCIMLTKLCAGGTNCPEKFLWTKMWTM